MKHMLYMLYKHVSLKANVTKFTLRYIFHQNFLKNICNYPDLVTYTSPTPSLMNLEEYSFLNRAELKLQNETCLLSDSRGITV